MKTKSDLAFRLAAEALVVVASILAAFQLDEWRDSRVAYRVETAQLAAIQTDLVENQARLDTVMVLQNRVVAAGRILLSIYAGERAGPSPDSVAELFGWAESWWRLEPVTGAYDAMVSSGDITRLQSRELLRELASFSGDLSAEFEDQAESMDLLAEMRRVVMQHGLGIFNRTLRERVGIGGSVSAAAVAAVLADQRYAQLVAHRTVMENNRLEYYENLSASMTRMRALLSAELTARGAT